MPYAVCRMPYAVCRMPKPAFFPLKSIWHIFYKIPTQTVKSTINNYLAKRQAEIDAEVVRNRSYVFKSWVAAFFENIVNACPFNI